MGFFYKHNIHPYTECMKRKEALQLYAETIDLKVIYQEGYDLEGFIQNVVFRESRRCSYCYHERLRSTALVQSGVNSTILLPHFCIVNSRNMTR